MTYVITDLCTKCMNCVKVCPKEIPLVSSIAAMSRSVTEQVIRDLFTKDAKKDKPSGPG